MDHRVPTVKSLFFNGSSVLTLNSFSAKRPWCSGKGLCFQFLNTKEMYYRNFLCEIFSTNVQEIIAISVEKIDFPAFHLRDAITPSSINISGVLKKRFSKCY